jgi:large subunit ribosomal protein L9
MKVILNKDLAPLGEEGDVKDVAKGYARNYLFPRGIAFPYSDKTVKLFESRRDEIEARKVQKRQDAAGLKEKLEALELTITMPAGANGKLYGSVTSQTVADEFVKHGFQIERKRIDIGGTGFKSVGKYKITVKLYESAAAELTLTVAAQQIKTETTDHVRGQRGRGRREEAGNVAGGENGGTAERSAGDAVPAEAETPEAPVNAGEESAPPAETPADTGSLE